MLDIRIDSKIEKTDGCWVWKAGKNQYGYGLIRYNGRCQLAHRVIYSVFNPGYKGKLDHKCRNRGCVNPDHLRECTQRENMFNKSGRVRNKYSQYKGVDKYRARWRARIQKDGKYTHIGMFDTELDAALAYNRHAATLFGEYAFINEINQ